MKISFNWLKQYLPTSRKPEEIAGMLTNCGLEVESMEVYQPVKGGLNGLVIGEVKTKRPHPNADRLSVTTVDTGTGIDLNIVCGAPNVDVGQKVVVAPVGTIMYPLEGGSFEIKKAKIRGELSEGMICAEDETGLGSSHEGIMVLRPDAVIGSPARDYFRLVDDYIFEIGLTPNRSDAASHIGVARDLSAVFNLLSETSNVSPVLPSVDNFKPDNNSRKIEIVVESSEDCPRYSGITLSNIKVTDSPVWLQTRLKSIGLKPVNNVVDVTNFVLHETGQPLHAFDAGKIRGNKIVVRKAEKGRKFITLDSVERTLSGDELMICNAEDCMAIGGIFGGLDSGVSENTTSIFIESAYFNPVSIRRTSKQHGLKTDASFRFERGSDPEITIYAMKRAALLIKEIAGGEITSDILDYYPEPIPQVSVKLTHSYLNKISGVEIETSVIRKILTSLEIIIESEDTTGFNLIIPAFKTDVRREPDVVEEILRIYGYNNIPMPDRLRSSLSFSEKPDRDRVQQMIADYLSANGFFEIINNSLSRPEYDNITGVKAEETVKILNPLSSELSVLRQHLLPSGLETIVYNRNRKRPDARYYEFGKSYHRFPSGYREIMHLSLFMTGKKHDESWAQPASQLTFYSLKSWVENILKKLNLWTDEIKSNTVQADHPFLSEGLNIMFHHHHLAEYGKVKKQALRAFDLEQDVFYADINWSAIPGLLAGREIYFKELPKYPEVRRDLALLVDRNIKYEQIEKLAFSTEKHILKSVNLFDVYEGEKLEQGKKSYALSFILQDVEKTLNDKQIEKVMNRLMETFEKQLSAVIRK